DPDRKPMSSHSVSRLRASHAAWRVVAACCVLLLSCWDVPRLAASASDSLSALNQRQLKTVHVERVNGHETSGRFVSSTDDELVLMVDGEKQAVPMRDIRTVSVMKRSTRKGSLIGFLIGGVIGGLSTQGAACADCGNGLAYA